MSWSHGLGFRVSSGFFIVSGLRVFRHVSLSPKPCTLNLLDLRNHVRQAMHAAEIVVPPASETFRLEAGSMGA